MLRTYTVLAVMAAAAVAQRQLILPDPVACRKRVEHASHFSQENGHYYFFSWSHRPTEHHKRDWLDARNICRKHCQDLVSIETAEENEFIKNAINRDRVQYIWTSGRKCNFDGCDRPDLQPIMVNGWFWSGSEAKIPPTNTTFGWAGDWSSTGGMGLRQPDNREFVQPEPGQGPVDEACVAILRDIYPGEGTRWHDISCHHTKPWVCEDSDELLKYARSRAGNIP